jgi:hypothetical protein
MSLPPERLFDLYFNDGSSRKTRLYRGRAKLDQLEGQTLPPNLLIDIQRMLNEALSLENKSVPQHVDHDPFHLDYIDSDHPNALAFCYGGYSFIGITIPLTTLLWNVCSHLSASMPLRTALGLDAPSCDRAMLHVVLFRLILIFVVSHEWSHHVRGHVSRQSRQGIWVEEIRVGSATASMETQSLEADADGYAAYFGLAHLIDSAEGRIHVVRLLNVENAPRPFQDQVLFSCFLAAFAGFVFVLPTPSLEKENLSRLTHPPQAARLHFLMQHAVMWCTQNRPLLAMWMTVDRFQRLMAAVASGLWAGERWNAWTAQVAFLLSADGAEYSRELTERLDALKAATGRQPPLGLR